MLHICTFDLRDTSINFHDYEFGLRFGFRMYAGKLYRLPLFNIISTSVSL